MVKPAYIPALRYNWLTKFYDPLIAITFPERKIKQALINAAAIQNNGDVLDFGVGTATLSMMIKSKYPVANITGIDVDEKILRIAKKKVGTAITLLKYDGHTLPFADNSFHKVLSSLVFHHIPTDDKRIVLKELFRVLKPGGSLSIADFDKAKTWYTKLAFGILRRFDGEENTKVNAHGLLPTFISSAGFTNVQQTDYFNTAFGTVVLTKATKQ